MLFKIMKNDIEEQIKEVVTTMIRNEIMSSSDYLPWRFDMKCVGVRYGSTKIVGPQMAADDVTVAGIFINTYLATSAHVSINPFPELMRSCTFEYSNPEFPDNMFRYIEQGVSDWLYWWEVFAAEQCYTTES